MSHNAISASGSAASCDSECREHQPRFVPVSEFAQPPHRRQRGRQISVDRTAFAFS
jgi:hypothetical protein